MGSETCSGLRSVELMTQETPAKDGDLSLDLRIEFTSRPDDTLKVLDLGKEFQVEVQGQLVYQIGGFPDSPRYNYDYGNDHGYREKGIAGENEVGYASDDAKQTTGRSTGSQENTLKKLCTRETVLTPVSTKRRLFPPSPSSCCANLDELNPFGDEDDDGGEWNKENKGPKEMGMGMEISTSPCPPSYGHRKRVTAIRVPRTPVEIGNQARQPLENDKSDLLRLVTPSPKPELAGRSPSPSKPLGNDRDYFLRAVTSSPKPELARRSPSPSKPLENDRDYFLRAVTSSPKPELARRSPSPSKIPIKTTKPFATPDRKPSSAVDSLLLVRPPELLLTTSKMKLKMTKLKVPKPASEPKQARYKSYSPGWARYWQGTEADGKPELGMGSIDADRAQDGDCSCAVRHRLPAKDRLDQFEKAPESPWHVKAGFTPAKEDCLTGFEYDFWDDPNVIVRPREAASFFDELQPVSQDSFVLRSPSASSQLSIPWNSAEDLIPKGEVIETPRRHLSPKVLPTLEYSNGIVYLASSKDVIEGVFVCDATLHIQVSTPVLSQKKIVISCPTANPIQLFSLKWGAHYSPAKSFVSAPKMSLKSFMDIPSKGLNSVIEVEADSDDGTVKTTGENTILTPSDTEVEEVGGRNANEHQEDSHAPTMEDVATHFRILVVALRIFLYFFGAVVKDKIRSWKPRWIDSWRQNRRRRRRWSRTQWLAWVVVLLAGMLLIFDEHCHIAVRDRSHTFPAGSTYRHETYRVGQSKPTEVCSRWFRGTQAIQDFVVAGDKTDNRRRHLGGMRSVAPIYVPKLANIKATSMSPWPSGVLGKSPAAKLECIKDDASSEDVQKSENNKQAVSDFSCRQIRAVDPTNFICVVNDTCSVTIPRSARHEKGFTVKGWVEQNHPEILGLPPVDAEESSNEIGDGPTEEVSGETSKASEQNSAEQTDPGETEIPLRDKIDYFLGWRGLG